MTYDEGKMGGGDYRPWLPLVRSPLTGGGRRHDEPRPRPRISAPPGPARPRRVYVWAPSRCARLVVVRSRRY